MSQNDKANSAGNGFENSRLSRFFVAAHTWHTFPEKDPSLS